MISSRHVPFRTPPGEACLSIADPRVSGRQRQLLRLIDGQRRIEQIATMLPGRELQDEIKALIDLGLVAGLAQKGSVVVPAALQQTLPERWHEAMAFMKLHAGEYLGLMALPIVHLLERVRDTDMARNAVARWHMALRESRNGREAADSHLVAVTDMLGL